ncbi:MAG: carbohydrate binding domain-containing protein [Bacteroidetes bacterium]|nr:carbohydrate binding domain-containing protein [Bacteroidota bacterium]
MLLVTDASGCSDSDFVCISVYSVLVTATVENVLCSGQSSGRIYGQVLGGLPGFTVVIDPDPNSVNPILSENYSFDNLPAGSYNITGVDGNGCTYTETFVVSEPLPISVTLTPPTDLCFGEQGPIDISASGGTGDYSYIIQPWATPGVLSNGSSITTIATFAAGTYTFTLTDNNGCTSSSNFTITPINCCDSLNPLGKELVVNGDFRNSSASIGSSLSLSCLCSFNSYCIGTNAQSKCGLLLNIADHSNTVSGTSGPYNFLIIDGHDSAPATIWSQNLGTLTGGKTYVFSYWIHPKISQPSPKPSMSLQVRDVLNNTIYTLHSVVSSAIPNQWTQYVGTWTPSTDITSAELFLFQTNFGYSGNDYGIDDISFKGCQPDCPDSILTTSLVMSTGFDHNTNSTYGTNVSDGGWSVVHATPDITAAKPYSAWTIAKHPSWPSALGNGQWISAYNHYRDEYSNPAPDSAYEFEYCFCLCKADTVKFDFNVLADDYAEFYLAEDPGTILEV